MGTDLSGMTAGGRTRRTVLVLDDDPGIQFDVQVILDEARLRVLPAFTAEAGLRIAAERTVDLALVDLRLPGLSGLHVLPSLRPLADRGGARHPVPQRVSTGQGAPVPVSPSTPPDGRSWAGDRPRA